MDKLEFEMSVRRHPIAFSREVFDNAMEVSRGQSEMSPTDIKACLLTLRALVDDQHKLIEVLYAELIKERKRSFLSRLLRK